MITLAIAAPAELVKEPAGVVTMLTVWALAAHAKNGANRQQAAVASAFIIILPMVSEERSAGCVVSLLYNTVRPKFDTGQIDRAARMLRSRPCDKSLDIGRKQDRWPCVTDPVTGLEYYELSHPWGAYTPILPGYEEIKFERITYHAKFGVMTHKFITIFHTSTHVNAPIHLIPRAPAVGDIPLETFFGTGVVLSIPKGKWELIEPADLQKATPKIRKGDIVLINTGWHHKYSDSIEYFGHSPGLSKKAAEWLVKKGVKLVGVDTPQVDHPLATSLGPHRNGPQIKYIIPEYKEVTGREAIKDFPEWNAAHVALLAPTSRPSKTSAATSTTLPASACTFQGFPWKWHEGDACVIRLVALLDPNGNVRLEPGKKGKSAEKPATSRRSPR